MMNSHSIMIAQLNNFMVKLEYQPSWVPCIVSTCPLWREKSIHRQPAPFVTTVTLSPLIQPPERPSSANTTSEKCSLSRMPIKQTQYELVTTSKSQLYIDYSNYQDNKIRSNIILIRLKFRAKIELFFFFFFIANFFPFVCR